jgi:hypothetical protein
LLKRLLALSQRRRWTEQDNNEISRKKQTSTVMTRRDKGREKGMSRIRERDKYLNINKCTVFFSNRFNKHSNTSLE